MKNSKFRANVMMRTPAAHRIRPEDATIRARRIKRRRANMRAQINGLLAEGANEIQKREGRRLLAKLRKGELE